MLPYISQNCKCFFEKRSSKNEQPNKEKGNRYQLNKTELFVSKLLTTDYKYVIISTLEHSVSRNTL